MPHAPAAAPTTPAIVDGCPTAPIAVPRLIDTPYLIYISGPDRSNDSKMVFTPDLDATLR
ncbi:MAG TPA: hypothetical protein VGG28_04915 [Kofleriaceae bacterium]